MTEETLKSVLADALEQDKKQTELTKPEYDFSILGLRDDIPEHIYHRSPGINKHGLDNISVSPLHYLTEKQNPKPSTPAMVIGSALHCLVLTPELFDQEYVREPKNKPRRPTVLQINPKKGDPKPEHIEALEWWRNWENKSDCKTIISDNPGDDPFWKPGDWQTIHNIRDAVRAHPIASILLDPDQGWAERSCYWMDKETGRLCRCRIDFFNEAHGLALDLKTAMSARMSDFMRSVSDYRYHVQAEMYSAGLKACGLHVQAFVFVAVEKVPPYGIGIYTLNPQGRHIGRAMWRQDMRTFDQCKKLDEWPCFPPEVRELNLPPWAEKGKIS